MTDLRRVRPLTWILVVFALAVFVGSWWNLPCTDAWSNDEVSPRASTLGAVFETWTAGHFFRYPPLHVLLLTILQSPVILVAGLRVGFTQDALGAELILPSYMTVSCIIGRVVAFAMASGVIVNIHRWWSRIASPRTGLFAAVLVAINPMFVYFAHTASVDVPYWFWTTWAMVELDRVAAGEAREMRALLLCAAAVLTKDQAAFLLVGAFGMSCIAVPVARAGLKSLWNKPLFKAVAVAALVYLLVSGALINPSGFRKKLAFMTGEGNQGWILYDRTWRGAFEQLKDIALGLGIFGSRLVAALVPIGVVLAARDKTLRLRQLAPAVSALTYLVLFVVPSRWTMERHLLPLTLMLFPYAGLVLDRAMVRMPRLQTGMLVAAGVCMLPTVVDVASIDATLVGDSRNAATRFLQGLPAGTKVEVIGGTTYLPHLPTHLALTRVGPEDFSLRSPLPGVTESRDRFLDIDQRAPEYLVVDERTARFYAPLPGTRLTTRGQTQASDPDGHGFFSALAEGRTHYVSALRAKCEVPWPLECKHVHLSTGSETWIFRRAEPGATQ